MRLIEYLLLLTAALVITISTAKILGSKTGHVFDQVFTYEPNRGELTGKGHSNGR